jgi:Flp pilus assembly protein TadD
MYLQNVLSLVTPLLHERPAPAQGNAGVSGSGTPSAAANGEKTAGTAGTIVKSSKPSGIGGSSRHQARDVLESEASLLEDTALVKLAYVGLCQYDFASTLRHSRRLLEKNSLLATKDSVPSHKADDTKALWTFQAHNFVSSASAGLAACVKHPSSAGCVTLAVMYLVEALLAVGKTAEAQRLLITFSRASPVAPEQSTGSESTSAGQQTAGLTPPWYCSSVAGSSGQKDHESKAGEEKEKSAAATYVSFPATELPQPQDTQCMLYTNLATLHAQDSNFAEAERCCELALKLQPRALAPLRTLVYILIRRDKHPQALELLRKNRLQRAAGGVAAEN